MTLKRQSMLMNEDNPSPLEAQLPSEASSYAEMTIRGWCQRFGNRMVQSSRLYGINLRGREVVRIQNAALVGLKL